MRSPSRRAARGGARPAWSGEIGLSVVLAVQIAIMFVAAPLAATGVLPLFAMDLFRMGLAAAAVLLVSRSRVLSIAIAATFLLSLGLSVGFGRGPHDTSLSVLRLATSTAFDISLAIVVSQIVFAEGRVTVHRIMGALIVYLSIGLVFANAYRVCALLLHPSFSIPGSHEGGGALSQMLYFSLSTLTTTGFGDIAPVHPFVRSLANLESIIGELFPATLLARLVTLHAAAGRGGQEADLP